MSLLKVALAAAASLPIIVAVAVADPQPVEDSPETVATAAETDVAPVKEGASAAEGASEGSQVSSANASGEAGDPNAAKEERKICKTVAPIGTRFGKKYCMTKKEWDAMRRKSQDDVADAQRRANEYRTPD